MRRMVCAALVAAVVMSGCLSLRIGGGNTTVAENPYLGQVRHMVWFKFTPETTPEKQAEIMAAARAMEDEMPEIADIEWGADLNGGARSEGYTHAFLVTFENEADLAAYGPHPVHEAFKAMAFPYIEGVLVVDYIARD